MLTFSLFSGDAVETQLCVLVHYLPPILLSITAALSPGRDVLFFKSCNIQERCWQLMYRKNAWNDVGLRCSDKFGKHVTTNIACARNQWYSKDLSFWLAQMALYVMTLRNVPLFVDQTSDCPTNGLSIRQMNPRWRTLPLGHKMARTNTTTRPQDGTDEHYHKIEPKMARTNTTTRLNPRLHGRTLPLGHSRDMFKTRPLLLTVHAVRNKQ